MNLVLVETLCLQSTLKNATSTRLIGKKLSLEALEKHLMLAKAELKEYIAETDDLKVELSDSNRPDLWSAEGIARQIRIFLAGKPEAISFFQHGRKATREIRVAKGMKAVRPYIAACTASGMRMNNDVLAQMIQSQDKLAEIFGRKRSTVSIGIYELDRIAFPVDYRLAEPSSVSFTPLGMEESLRLAEILEQHPKGIAYGGIVKPFPAVPGPDRQPGPRAFVPADHQQHGDRRGEAEDAKRADRGDRNGPADDGADAQYPGCQLLRPRRRHRAGEGRVSL